MSNWIPYDEFIDLVRNHHHNGFTGLITGVSEQQHAFKVGFDQGQIVLLTYRIKKGMPALELLARIEQAKVTEYPTSSTQYKMDDMPDTATILSQLTANTLEDATVTEISEVPELEQPQDTYAQHIDSVVRKNIEVAAVHHFGPIGAMVCDELLRDYRGDLRTAVLAIAQEVGANESDTRAFFQSVTED